MRSGFTVRSAGAAAFHLDLPVFRSNATTLLVRALPLESGAVAM